MGRNTINFVMGCIVAMAVGMAGCGGGGSSTPTVYGTASEGALITGKTVKLKDANGQSAADATTDPVDGSYSIDVTGLTPPFLVTIHGDNGYYLTFAGTAGKANINPITSSVVALAAGTPDLPMLFDSVNPALLAAISDRITCKCALFTTSLQALLPDGLNVENYFTGTITQASGLDGMFDRYLITVDPVNGIAVRTNDTDAMSLLSIPGATILANTDQPLPTITTPTAPLAWIQKTGDNVWTVYGSGLDRIGGVYVRIMYETTLQNPAVTPGSIVAGALSNSNIATPGFVYFVAVSPTPFASTSGPIAVISFGSGSGRILGLYTEMATANDNNPEKVQVSSFIMDMQSPPNSSTESSTVSAPDIPVDTVDADSPPNAGTQPVPVL